MLCKLIDYYSPDDKTRVQLIKQANEGKNVVWLLQTVHFSVFNGLIGLSLPGLVYNHSSHIVSFKKPILVIINDKPVYIAVNFDDIKSIKAGL